MNREQYPQQNTARMEKILVSSADCGLSHAEAEARLKKDQKSDGAPKQRSTFLSFLKTITCNGSLPIYLLALCLALPFLGIRVILPSCLYLVFLCVYYVFFLKRERGLQARREALAPFVRVVREGKTVFLSPEELVVGDLLLLSEGDVLYTYAHVTTDEEMSVFCLRGEKRENCVKHGGDCFEDTAEPFNTLMPGDIIREGEGRAFVTEKVKEEGSSQSVSADTVRNHGNMCAMATRVSFALAFVLLLVGFIRSCYTADYLFLSECLLIGAVLVATASTTFYPLLFDLLFLYRNKRSMETNGGFFVSIADAEAVTEADAFVLSTRSMFRSARYVARYFETASGRRVTEKMRGTKELSLLADALFSTQRKCVLSMEEEATLGFCAKHAAGRSLELISKTTNGKSTLTSFKSITEGRNFSLMWGDAGYLIPKLQYFSEDGKTRLLDAKLKGTMLDGVGRLEKSGYRMVLFAETQTRSASEGAGQSFSDMKLLGFFALRRVSDGQAARTLEELKEEGKKVFFTHDGENANWLKREIRLFDGVPILDGERESFREELSHFIKDEDLPFCIGIRLSPIQKAQVVTALEASGRKVIASGASFEDHRMMSAASGAIAPLKKDSKGVPSLVIKAASVRAEEHISSQIDTVKGAERLLGSFGVFTAVICASLLGRTMVALLGALLGNVFLSTGYYALIGIVFDLLGFYCFIKIGSGKRYDGLDGLAEENERNISLFAGFLAGALTVGVLASYVALHPQSFAFLPGAFVFVSLLLMLNVGMWRFSSAEHTASILLFPTASVLTAVALFLAGHFSDGRVGFVFRAEVLFWALFPVTVLLAVGRVIEAYFKQKYTFKVGEKDE